MKKILITLPLILNSYLAHAATEVFYVDLKEGEPITAAPLKEYPQNKKISKGTDLAIYPDITFQRMEGLGGCFNEIGAVALFTLPEQEREKIMKALFSEEGAKFSFCRTALGASDFGVDAYSYSEAPGDYNMNHFSIEREKNSIIPYIQMAIKSRPDMKLFASPWSPPGWMKYSGLMDKGITMPAKNKLIDDPQIYKSYALYFAKYVQAYAAEGIKVDRVVIQNENDVDTPYPSCVMPPSQMYELVSKYMRPQFEKDQLSTGIWAGTFRTAGKQDGLEFVRHPEYLQAVDGIGIQYTPAKYIADMRYFSGNKALMHTESNCFNGDNSITQALTRFEEVASYINSGTSNFAYWNMILNETSKSGWDWKQNSLITIDRNSKKVQYHPDFAVMSLLSHYIQPGSTRIASFARETVISIKQGTTRIIFVQNQEDKEKNYICREGDKLVAKASIPAHSVAVILYSL